MVSDAPRTWRHDKRSKKTAESLRMGSWTSLVTVEASQKYTRPRYPFSTASHQHQRKPADGPLLRGRVLSGATEEKTLAGLFSRSSGSIQHPSVFRGWVPMKATVWQLEWETKISSSPTSAETLTCLRRHKLAESPLMSPARTHTSNTHGGFRRARDQDIGWAR